MKHVNHKSVALAAMVVAAMGMPALAQSMDRPTERPMTTDRQLHDQQVSTAMMAAQADAYETITPALTYTESANQQAALTYLDDGLGLLTLAETHLQAGNARQAQAALMAASGKLTNAYLLHFQDRDFSDNVRPLAMEVHSALDAVMENPQQALSEIRELRPAVASIARTQLAQLQGGGGGGVATTGTWESLNFINLEPNR